ncbi:hypothetical protein C2S53_010657 [Perilla frutescens var. hirtella]|uniref:WRKY domain-containing protein n=1 Tax=Perilla frutescens var. hirtella TaxID=608512 RepID=A0AAD4JAR7_PERFH|nr:hypothetical protein C2S53_010657 [Perilla frutescens var. hirtella]
MEKVGVLSDKKTVINVLTEGKKLANELKSQLHPTTTSREACDVLLESILSSYENAITLLALIGNGASSQIAAGKLFEPPNSMEGSEGSNHNSKDQVQNSKKRKSLPRWSEHVRVCSGTGSEGQIDDGYNWRKYGQKDILGANHPRAYYRCTHRNTQGCLATKQVQRADEDPMMFEVIYRGKHSCRQERLRQKKERKEEEMQQEQVMMKTNSKAFSFPQNDLFPAADTVTNSLLGPTYSPSFLSPATSDSYFSLSPCPVNDFGIALSLHTSDSDFAEIISNPTPAMDFTFRDLDLSFDDAVSFESHFLDALDYLH